MDFIPKYIAGKNDRHNIVYDCPQLEPILKNTYGCIVYQEQVMQIVRDLAGYSYGQSDNVRRAMSKKKAKEMERNRSIFIYGDESENIEGCIKRGIPEETASKIYADMTDFAKYAFNKSHAAAYAVVSYQTAYLKYYYPKEFMAALLTSVMDNTGKITEYTMSCRQMGIEILPPDINEGEANFTPTENGIRYGLAAIKSVGRPVIAEIVTERRAAGPYASLKDLCSRLSGKSMNKRTLESFIKAGALDCLDGTRKQKMSAYASILEGISHEKKATMTGQLSLFDFASDEDKEELETKFPDVGEYDKEMILAFEKEVLGLYISGHPLEDYVDVMKRNITRQTIDFTVADGERVPRVKDNETAVIGGLIENKVVKTTKTNNMMAFITIEDLLGTVEVIVFPRDYENYRPLLENDRKVFVKGRVTVEEDKPAKMICQKIVPFDEVPNQLWIQFTDKQSYLAAEQSLFDSLAKYDGQDTVIVYLSTERAKKQLPNSRMTKVCPELLEELYKKFTKENVKVVQMSIEKVL